MMNADVRSSLVSPHSHLVLDQSFPVLLCSHLSGRIAFPDYTTLHLLKIPFMAKFDDWCDDDISLSLYKVKKSGSNQWEPLFERFRNFPLYLSLGVGCGKITKAFN